MGRINSHTGLTSPSSRHRVNHLAQNPRRGDFASAPAVMPKVGAHSNHTSAVMRSVVSDIHPDFNLDATAERQRRNLYR